MSVPTSTYASVFSSVNWVLGEESLVSQRWTLWVCCPLRDFGSLRQSILFDS